VFAPSVVSALKKFIKEESALWKAHQSQK
jgi:hypothetical protein